MIARLSVGVLGAFLSVVPTWSSHDAKGLVFAATGLAASIAAAAFLHGWTTLVAVAAVAHLALPAHVPAAVTLISAALLAAMLGASFVAESDAWRAGWRIAVADQIRYLVLGIVGCAAALLVSLPRFSSTVATVLALAGVLALAALLRVATRRTE